MAERGDWAGVGVRVRCASPVARVSRSSSSFRGIERSRALVLRQEVAVLRRPVSRPPCQPSDRIMLTFLSRIVPRSQGQLALSVRPATLLAGPADWSPDAGPLFTEVPGGRQSRRGSGPGFFAWPRRTRAGVVDASRARPGGWGSDSLAARWADCISDLRLGAKGRSGKGVPTILASWEDRVGARQP